MTIPKSDPWSYVAGVYEGAGWITVQTRKGRSTQYANVVFGMIDKSPLEEVQRIIGGRLNGPYGRHGGGTVAHGDYQSRYALTLTRRAEIDQFLDHVYAHLSPKKQEAVLIAMARDTRGPWSAP